MGHALRGDPEHAAFDDMVLAQGLIASHASSSNAGELQIVILYKTLESVRRHA